MKVITGLSKYILPCMKKTLQFPYFFSELRGKPALRRSTLEMTVNDQEKDQCCEKDEPANGP
jgi:hypothetical protein